MSKTSIEIIDEKSFSTVVAEEIVATINDSISERGKCSLSLSGGSTPSAIYRLLSRPPLIKEVNWNKVLIFFGDERWVAKESKHSNYLMIHETLLNNVKIPDSNIYSINYSLASAEQSAADYEHRMRSALSCDSNGVPIFDIILLGVGEDGHTASIFPGDANALSSDKICVSASRPDGLEAVTMTAKVLKNARNVIFILKGEGKADMAKLLLEEDSNEKVYPAAIYKSMQGKVTWFLDSHAATKLEKSKTKRENDSLISE